MLTETEQEKAMMFLSLMQVLYEMADDADLNVRPFNKGIVKERVWSLTNSLNKEIAKVFNGKPDEDWDRAVEQHTHGAERMLLFYKIGMRLVKLDPIKLQGFDTQLTILLKTYGIE